MEKGLYGSKEWIYVDRSRERKLPFLDDTIGWSTFGDLKTMGYAEWFTLVRDLNFYRKGPSVNQRTASDSDIYLSRVGDSKLFEKVRNKLPGKTTRIFDSKTQGHNYHNYILANEDEYPVEMLWKLRQSKDQLIDQLPDSMIDKLKETIEEIGYDRNAP